MRAADTPLRSLGQALARFLMRPNPNYEPPATSSIEDLARTLQPADVLLVEGNTRVSTAVKFLTQSTWSHAALYVGPRPELGEEYGQPRVLVEADLVHGVRAVALGRYADFHTRICRPVDLTKADRERVLAFAVDRLGYAYDLRNLIDLVRYLLPLPPVPTRLRRRMIELGSGEPTRAICSTLIAQAFQSVRYPILPFIEYRPGGGAGRNAFVEEVLRARHHSLFTPRDFDISPYFRVIKPRIERGFDYNAVRWDDESPRIPENPRRASGLT
jgi:hypothetical protein